MVVEGTAGPDKVKWKSEPHLFRVVAVGRTGFMQPLNPYQPALPYAVLAPGQPAPRYPVLTPED